MVLFFAVPPVASADYADELKSQIKDTESQYAAKIEPAYFHDMGIIAHKADDAGLYDLLTDIIKQDLFKKMDASLQDDADDINKLMERDPYTASRMIEQLFKFQVYYEPSKEFLKTGAGQAMEGEEVKLRSEALARFKGKTAEAGLIKGLQAYHRAGLFMTRKKNQDDDLAQLSKKLGCTVGWAHKLRYRYEQEFKTDYEKGTLVEEAELTLQTPADEYVKAEWRGPWLYKYKGRDGEAQGTSEAVLKIRRGAYEGELVITASKLSSTGRFNFPANLSGEQRQVEIHGTGLQPEVKISETVIPLTGCEDLSAPKPAAVENKNGRVLLS